MNKRQRDTTMDTDQIELDHSSKRPRNNDEETYVKKKPKILDGKFFKIGDGDEKNENILVTCTSCKKAIKGQLTSTGNFYKHYRRVHKDIFIEMKEYCDTKISKGASAESSTAHQSKLTDINQINQRTVIKSIPLF